MKTIAHINSDFPSKFGIPRQSGLVPELLASIVFEPEYRNPEALRGLEQYSHIWLLWEFSEAKRETFSPTVRPPRLGGNQRMGVFATRSPFRPNPIGLSCVVLERVELHTPKGPILYVSGADLMDGTPIYDIKPYLPHIDSHPDALGGFALPLQNYALAVEIPEELLEKVPKERREALRGILMQDPRPGYQEDPGRVYGFPFAGLEVRFQVKEGKLTVCEVEKMDKEALK
ncbi:MAG: tRNA (N6-threonylcarbamoyladenosine(37)-N6)-methyltransferase TrmO [Eubacteriales bacterium]|nr:tRNA (N6-threonylcarbamoyladenosine(37)-N6)-methyltransferase TrmO [Eubacteriales bacterium]